MSKSLFHTQRGSTTIEAVLVVSALLIALAALIVSFMLLYQQVLLSHTAYLVAQEAAQLWVEDNGLYYRLFEDEMFSGKQSCFYTSPSWLEVNELLQKEEGFYQNKFTKIKIFALARLNKAFYKPENINIKMHYNNNSLTRRITIILSRELAIPFGNIRKLFNDKGTITLTGEGSAVIIEPVGYIRNIDLALEYGTKVKEAVDVEAVIQKLKAGVRKNENVK